MQDGKIPQHPLHSSETLLRLEIERHRNCLRSPGANLPLREYVRTHLRGRRIRHHSVPMHGRMEKRLPGSEGEPQSYGLFFRCVRLTPQNFKKLLIDITK